MSLSTLEHEGILPDKRLPAEAERLVTAVISDGEEMERLAPEWQSLADRCAYATVFQTYEWNAIWWRHYGRGFGRRLYLLTVREGVEGRLVGLAPLMASFWYGTPLRRLSFVGTGASDYLDLLALPGYEQGVVDAFHEHLRHVGGWQVADLQQMRDGGLLRHYPPSSDSGLICRDVDGEPCPYLVLPADWETLARQLGKKTRANINYYERALRKVHDVEFSVVSRPEALDGELARLFELHQRRWNKRWLPGVFGNGRVQKFHHDIAQALLERGWLRLFVLRLDGRTEASLYCFAFGDRLCYYQGGFEPDLAKWSLGTVLTAHAIQSAIRGGRAVFDFLRGDEPYKAKWTQTTRLNRRRLLTRRGRLNWGTLAGRIVDCETRVERRAKAWARSRK